MPISNFGEIDIESSKTKFYDLLGIYIATIL
jgi:hypothetical protein